MRTLLAVATIGGIIFLLALMMNGCASTSNPSSKGSEITENALLQWNCRCSYYRDDIDGDDICNFCDKDIDGDGVLNYDDNCPLRFSNTQRDNDHDGVGNACDNCLGTPNGDQADSDGDGVGDQCDPSHQWMGLLRPYKEREGGEFGIIMNAPDSPLIMIPPDFSSVREDGQAWMFNVPYGKDGIFDIVILEMKDGILQVWGLGNTGMCLTKTEAGAAPPPNEGWFKIDPANLRPVNEKEAARPECAPYINTP